MEPGYCEACKINRAYISKEDDHPGLPSYELCGECCKRLENFALRPLEWFNLKAIHGNADLLDPYDIDTGEALHPEMDVSDANDFPHPSLEEVKDDVERLMDYAIVQPFDRLDDAFLCLQKLDKTEILKSVSKRLDRKYTLQRRLLMIVGHGVGVFAADWVREYWKKNLKSDYRGFAVALAQCLPFDEAFREIMDAVKKANESVEVNLELLGHFEQPAVLDWIETMTDQIKEKNYNAWGELASLSKLDWARTKKWLDAGQPLSSIALEALLCCTTTDPDVPFPFIGSRPAKLFNPQKIEVMARALSNYAEKDPSPDVQQCVEMIIGNLFDVVE